jgi:hypothetical protein
MCARRRLLTVDLVPITSKEGETMKRFDQAMASDRDRGGADVGYRMHR